MTAQGLANGIAVLAFVVCLVGSLLVTFYRSLVWGLLGCLASYVLFMFLLAWATSL